MFASPVQGQLPGLLGRVTPERVKVERGIQRLDLSPDGKSVVYSSGQDVYVVSFPDGKLIRKFTGGTMLRSFTALLFLAAPCIALDPPPLRSSPHLSGDPRVAEMFRLVDRDTPVAPAYRPLGELTFAAVEFPATAAAVAIAPDGKSAVGTAHAPRDSFEAFVVSLPGGKALKTFSGAKENPLGQQRAIAFTPDGKKVVGVSPGIRVWDVGTGKVELSVDWRWERDAFVPGTGRPPVVPAAPVISPDATRAYVCGPKGEVIAQGQRI